MKVLTVLGTRPEIIRLSLIIPLLDKYCEHRILHTGQNFDARLNDIFFQELGVRSPDRTIDSKSTGAISQISKILIGCEKEMVEHRPDRVLVLGDTNSGLAAYVAKRLGIKVYHMEAGNRCFDDRVPEEINRRVIDQCSDVLLPYTERSRSNLLREGIASERIFVTGNPIFEVLEHYNPTIEKSDILGRMDLVKGKYFLVTMHRAENVDEEERLSTFISAFNRIVAEYDTPLIWSIHPRTKARLLGSGNMIDPRIVLSEPFGLFDFVKLEKNAFCVLTDSGTVQEETSIFNIPNVTLRDVTERPETVEVGSGILSGCSEESILTSIRMSIELGNDWQPPSEYLNENVSRTVLKVVLGFNR